MDERELPIAAARYSIQRLLEKAVAEKQAAASGYWLPALVGAGLGGLGGWLLAPSRRKRSNALTPMLLGAALGGGLGLGGRWLYDRLGAGKAPEPPKALTEPEVAKTMMDLVPASEPAGEVGAVPQAKSLRQSVSDITGAASYLGMTGMTGTAAAKKIMGNRPLPVPKALAKLAPKTKFGKGLAKRGLPIAVILGLLSASAALDEGQPSPPVLPASEGQ